MRPAGSPAAEKVYGVTPPVAPKFAVYAVPTTPVLRLVVETASAGGLIVNDKVLVAVFAGLAESVTMMVTLDVPAAVGMPVIWFAVTVRPAGSPVAENVYGETPPVAPKFAVYADPTTPVLRLVVETASAGGLIVNDRVFVAVFAGLAESVTIMVTLDVPAAVGMPVI